MFMRERLLVADMLDVNPKICSGQGSSKYAQRGAVGGRMVFASSISESLLKRNCARLD